MEINLLDELINSDIKDETMDKPKEKEPIQEMVENESTFEMFNNTKMMEPRVVLDKTVVDSFIKGETMLNFKEEMFDESESDMNSESSYELFTPQHNCDLCQKEFKTESAYKAHCTKYHPEAKRGPKPKIMLKSPWDVTTLEEFLCYCCPECDIKHSSKSKFFIHAIDKHPESQEFLQSFEINEDSHWEDDDTFAMFDDDPIKEELIDPSEPIKESDSGSDFESDYFRPKQFDCCHCDKKFNTDHALIRHKKQYHPGAKRGPKRIPKQVDKSENVEVKPEEPIKQETPMDTEEKPNESEESEVRTRDVKCDQCDRSFFNYNGLMCHMKSHKKKTGRPTKYQPEIEPITGKLQYKCDQCNVWFPSVSTLCIHNSIYHSVEINGQAKVDEGQEQFECLVCFGVFPDVILLRRHLKLKHLTKDGVFKCDHCTKQFSSASREKFFYHLTKEHGIGKFTIKCDKCDNKIFETSAKLRNHDAIYHPTKPRHVCDKCGKDFRDKKHLQTHLLRVHQEFIITNKDKVKECDTCHEEFSSAIDFNDHLKSCLPKLNDFKCKFCNLSLVSHLSLELHFIEEHNVLMFCCQVCGLAFKQKTDIKSHVERIHEKLFKHLCHKCDKSFYYRKQLTRHLAIWHNEGSSKRDYKCNTCGNIYKNLQGLNEHKIRTHDRSEIHSCDRCNYTTYIKKDLLAHTKHIHEGYKPNKCELCGTAYLYKRDLIKHKEKNHQIFQHD